MNLYAALSTMPQSVERLYTPKLALSTLRMRVATQLWYYEHGNPCHLHSLTVKDMREWLEETRSR